jgi:hypothetical protein
MPLDITRLFASAFHAKANDAEWRAGLTLILKSWHQRPAGSLPDDDIALCRLAELGRDLKTWRRIRGNALHGWMKHSDGRLYHAVVTEKVLDAWDKRGEFRAKASAKTVRQQRWRERCKKVAADLRAHGITPPAGASLEVMEGMLVTARASSDASAPLVDAPVDACVDAFVDASVDGVDASEMPKRGRGRGRGTETETEKPHHSVGRIVVHGADEVAPQAAEPPAMHAEVPARISFVQDDGAGVCRLDVPERLKRRWRETYTAIDVDQHLLRAALWLAANPNAAERKADRLYPFCVHWLSKAHDRYCDAAAAADINGARHVSSFIGKNAALQVSVVFQ